MAYETSALRLVCNDNVTKLNALAVPSRTFKLKSRSTPGYFSLMDKEKT